MPISLGKRGFMREESNLPGTLSSDELQKLVMASATLELSKDDKFLSELGNNSNQVRGQAYYRLAKVYYDKSDIDAAEVYFEKALELTEFPRDVFGSLKICGFLIRISHEKLELDKVEKYITYSENLVDNYSAQAPTLNGEYFYYLGIVQTYRRNFAHAEKNFEIAYRKTQEENEPDLRAKALYSIANCYFHLKKYDEVLTTLDKLEELLMIIKKDFLKGSLFLLRGQIYTETGKYQKALDNYDFALKTLRLKKCWNLYCYILLGMGRVSKKLGEFKKAMIFFELAQSSINGAKFKNLNRLIKNQIEDVKDSSVDIYLDRHNRLVHEKQLGTIDFKHRFVLLEILFLLSSHPGEYFDKEKLAQMIWKDEYNPLIHDKLIYTSVSRLRKLVEPKNGDNKYILRGKDGYTFNPRITARFYEESASVHDDHFGSLEISAPI